MSKRSLVNVLLAALGVLVLATACGGDEPTTPETQATAETQTKAPVRAPAPRPVVRKNRQTIHDQLAQRVELPEFYPADGVVYPGSTLNTAGWQAGRVATVFSTEDGVAEVSSFVAETLGSQGWDQVQKQEMPNGEVTQGWKDSRTISVLVSRLDAENKTLIAVSVDPES